MKFQSRYPDATVPMMLLASAQFQTMLGDDSIARLPLLESKSIPLHGVGRIPGSKRNPAQRVVRLSLGKTNLTAALRPDQDFIGTCRLADLVTLFFWKYRVRVPTSDLDRYNFSKAQATADLEGETDIRLTLTDLELAWVRAGALPTEAELAARKQSNLAAKVKTSLRKQVDGWADVIAGLVKGQADDLKDLAVLTEEVRQGFLTARAERVGASEKLETQIANLVVQFQRIADSVDTIAKSQVILHTAVSKISKSSHFTDCKE